MCAFVLSQAGTTPSKKQHATAVEDSSTGGLQTAQAAPQDQDATPPLLHRSPRAVAAVDSGRSRPARKAAAAAAIAVEKIYNDDCCISLSHSADLSDDLIGDYSDAQFIQQLYMCSTDSYSSDDEQANSGKNTGDKIQRNARKASVQPLRMFTAAAAATAAVVTDNDGIGGAVDPAADGAAAAHRQQTIHQQQPAEQKVNCLFWISNLLAAAVNAVVVACAGPRLYRRVLGRSYKIDCCMHIAQSQRLQPPSGGI